MSITSTCTECGARSQEGLLSHESTCTAAKPPTITAESRMPAIELSFDSKAEQEKFMANLTGSTKGNDLRAYDPEVTTKDTVTSPKATIEDKLTEIGKNLIADGQIKWFVDDLMAIITTETTKAENELAKAMLRQAEYMIAGGEVVHAVSTENIKAVVPSIAALQKDHHEL